MLYYATKYRFSTLGPVPASCSKEQDLVLCSLGWQLFFGGQGGQIRHTDRHRQHRWQERKKWKIKKWQRGVLSFVTLTYCCLPFFFFLLLILLSKLFYVSFPQLVKSGHNCFHCCLTCGFISLQASTFLHPPPRQEKIFPLTLTP